eukprot:765190-Hanusia_phi.AAC.1
MHGGPDAYINIKYMIPTYESCMVVQGDVSAELSSNRAELDALGLQMRRQRRRSWRRGREEERESNRGGEGGGECEKVKEWGGGEEECEEEE